MTKTNIRLLLFFIPTFVLLSACSFLQPVKTDYNTYVLNTVPYPEVKPCRHITLIVTPVEADPLYDTDNMAYTNQPYHVDYFAKNKWADTPARMVQPLLLQTLRNTHHFHAITTSRNALRYNYVLNTKILELRQVFKCNTSYVIFRIHAEIISAKTGQIIAAREFTDIEEARQLSPQGGIPAANIAVANVLSQLAHFCITVM